MYKNDNSSGIGGVGEGGGSWWGGGERGRSDLLFS